MTYRNPKNREEFEAFMEAIDAEFESQCIDLPSRAFLAVLKFPGNYTFPSKGYVPREDNFTGPDLFGHVQQWYEIRYADCIKRRCEIGKFTLVIRGTAWLVRIPVPFGQGMVYIAREPDPQRGHNSPRCNVLDLIDELPDRLREALTETELDTIFRSYVIALESFLAMNAVIGESDFVNVAFSDHDATVAHILSPTPHYGQAKWSALQASEKMIKAVLVQSGTTFPRVHNLHELVALVKMAGSFPAILLDQAQCPAQIRYEPSSLSLREAVSAHHTSLEISRQCALALR